MNPIEQLKSVLCNSEGKCCIAGSDEDRAIVDRALQSLAKQEQGEPVACERCKQLEEQAYDLLGKLKVANIKLAYTPPQRTWVNLTDEDWEKIWAKFDDLDVDLDFQDHMVSKHGDGHYTDMDLYWRFQQQLIKEIVNTKLKEQK
jgi:hypothetical protein